MKNFCLVLLALSLPLPVLADSSEVPENFAEAIQNESAGDQGYETRNVPGKLKPELKAKLQKSLIKPRGEYMERKSLAAKKVWKPEDADTFIRRVIQFNELYGVETPMSESGCRDSTNSRADFEKCKQMLEFRSAVLSSRQAAQKKAAGHHSLESDKASINFDNE